MTHVLVDTSVWIDALNGKKTRQTARLTELLDEDAPTALCPVIVQEILQGIKEDKDFNIVQDTLLGFDLLEIDPLVAACGAASIYRKARKHGTTIRKSNDCLIAFYAVYCNATLLHNDADFDKIAQSTNLNIFQS